MEFREHATDYFENLARRYRVSALTRYSVARDKYSIERRFTVNWVRNLQWCIVVLYRRERERERGREDKPRNAFPIRSRVLHFSSTTFIGKRVHWCLDICITDRSALSLILSRYLSIELWNFKIENKIFQICLFDFFFESCSKKWEM